jgi:hypothetical protein
MTIASCATYISETYATNGTVASGEGEAAAAVVGYRAADVAFVVVFSLLFLARRFVPAEPHPLHGRRAVHCELHAVALFPWMRPCNCVCVCVRVCVGLCVK